MSQVLFLAFSVNVNYIINRIIIDLFLFIKGGKVKKKQQILAISFGSVAVILLGFLGWALLSGKFGIQAIGTGSMGVIKGTVYCEDTRCDLKLLQPEMGGVHAENIITGKTYPAVMGTVSDPSRGLLRRSYTISDLPMGNYQVYAMHNCGAKGVRGSCGSAGNKQADLTLESPSANVDLYLVVRNGPVTIQTWQVFPPTNDVCPQGSTKSKGYGGIYYCYAPLIFADYAFKVNISGEIISFLRGYVFRTKIYWAGTKVYVNDPYKIGTCTLRDSTSTLTIVGCPKSDEVQKVYYDCKERYTIGQ